LILVSTLLEVGTQRPFENLKVRVRVGVRLRSEIYKLQMHDFQIVQSIFYIAQIDKSCATFM